MSIRDISLSVASVIVASAMAMSGFRHIDNHFYFLSTIYSYRIVWESVGIALSILIPFLQLVIAIGLLFDKKGRTAAFVLASALFLVFSMAQISAWYRGLNISCGCFGSSDDNPIGVQSISLAVVGFLLSLTGAILNRTAPIPEGSPS